MTTQAEAICELIAKIKAGDVGDWGFAQGTPRKALPHLWEIGFAAYNGSLDAAMALHKALLPGWVAKEMLVNGFGDCYFEIERKDHLATRGATSRNHARAWLLAILKAYLAEMEA